MQHKHRHHHPHRTRMIIALSLLGLIVIVMGGLMMADVAAPQKPIEKEIHLPVQ